jgi:hypothetical protein
MNTDSPNSGLAALLEAFASESRPDILRHLAVAIDARTMTCTYRTPPLSSAKAGGR